MEWGRAKEEGVGDPSGQILALRLLPLKEEQCMPLSLGRGGTWKVGTAGTFLGRVAWGPVLGPICPPSLLPPPRAWGSRKRGCQVPWPNPIYRGPPTPAGDSGNLLDAQSPTQPCHPSPGVVPHNSPLLAPSGARSAAPQQLPGPLPLAAGREGTGP